jgi:hypothetical protein
MKSQSEDQGAAVTNPATGSETQPDAPETMPEIDSPGPARAAPARGNGRPLPASMLTPPPPAPSPHLDDYQNIIGQGLLDALRFLARDLEGKSIKMVNSTAVGGGVAEMLNRLVPLLSELEVPTHWDVITGGNDCFEVTKAFHNALHGSNYELTKAAQEIFLMYNEQNRERLRFGKRWW